MAKVKWTKARIISLISVSLAVILIASLLIINIFIPVQYISAYLFSGSKPLEGGAADVTFVDVGYGNAAIIRFPDGKNMLIDGGSGEYNGTLKLITELNKRQVKHIDYLICSSVRSEHCGGLTDAMRGRTVGEIFMPYVKNTYITDEYREFYLAAKECGAKLTISEYGVGASGEDYFFSFLSPSAHDSNFGEYSDLNISPTSENIASASAVVWVQCKQTSLLFSSDAPNTVFAKIVEEYGIITSAGDNYAQVGDYFVNLEDCDIICVADHGAAAYAPFYDRFKPTDAIVSVGENTFGAPSVDALSTVCNTAEAYLTKECGNIEIEISDGYTVIKEIE